MEREAKRLSRLQSQQPKNIAICPVCHLKYHQKIITKHQKSKECTIAKFIFKWLQSSNTLKQHMLKFSEPDLRQLVFEYGFENSQLSQHSTNSKLQFQQFSQNQETIISVFDSSDDESSSFHSNGNPTRFYSGKTN